MTAPTVAQDTPATLAVVEPYQHWLTELLVDAVLGEPA